MADSIEKLSKQLKKEQSEKAVVESELAFMGTYGDAITLLMAFFVLLFAMSSLDAQKFEAFAKALSAELGTMPVPGDSIVQSGTLEQINEGPMLSEPVTLAPVRSPNAGEGDESNLGATELDETAAELRDRIAEAGLDDLIEVEVTTEGLLIRITSDDVLYDTGSAQMQDLGRTLIETVAPILAAYDNPILVTGHTDDVPVDADGYDNWALSTDRAVSVVRLLSEGFGLDPTRLSAQGRGEFEPLVPNVDDESRAMNRRVELLVAVSGPAEAAEVSGQAE